MKKVAIITASDAGYKGEREDISGPKVIEIIEKFGYTKVAYQVLPDEQEMLEKAMIDLADNHKVDLILTTGGTGFSKRDCTPEATKNIIQREVPGIPEAMRLLSMEFTKRAVLSRGAAGIRGNTLIVNLPGSPKAVAECLEYILPELDHGLEILLGEASNCAR
jgi:molybdenum cofactor synthesis domain-containing protein